MITNDVSRHMRVNQHATPSPVRTRGTTSKSSNNNHSKQSFLKARIDISRNTSKSCTSDQNVSNIFVSNNKRSHRFMSAYSNPKVTLPSYRTLKNSKRQGNMTHPFTYGKVKNTFMVTQRNLQQMGQGDISFGVLSQQPPLRNLMGRATLHEVNEHLGNSSSVVSSCSLSSKSSSSGTPSVSKKRRFREAGGSANVNHKNAVFNATNTQNRRSIHSASGKGTKAICNLNKTPNNDTTKNSFEKLNTLKLLLDAGHIIQDEYEARKTQLINEMTGTCADPKIPFDKSTNHMHYSAQSNQMDPVDKVARKLPVVNPSCVRMLPVATLQPLLQVVIPHDPPDFSRIMQESAEKLSFDVDSLEWHSMSTNVKIDLVPFATGQLRNAYYLQDVGVKGKSQGNDDCLANTKLLVAKFMIQSADVSTYLSDIEMQAVCAHYARLYNEHEPPLKVDYAQSWLLKLPDRKGLVCCVEEYLPGAYVKYSNNNGFVGKATSATEERERNTPHAFSHFTFVASDYRLMVVDIQGVHDSYTDPQIHTFDGRGFGAGNLGTIGMEKFLQTHRCNEICQWLGLPALSNTSQKQGEKEEDEKERYKAGGTAAPKYKMPFGNAIKKSTHRTGIEARNTFSKSITVSEVLGEEFVCPDEDDEFDSRRHETSDGTDAYDSDSSLEGEDFLCRTSSSFASTATTTRTTTASISAEERDHSFNGYRNEYRSIERRRRNALRIRKAMKKKKMREEWADRPYSITIRTDEDECPSSHKRRISKRSRKRNLPSHGSRGTSKRKSTNATWFTAGVVWQRLFRCCYGS